MAARVKPLVLDLAALPDAVDLSRPVVEAVALAASVVLDKLHGPGSRDAASIRVGRSRRTAEILRVAVDDEARDTYGDFQEATEEGGEAIALAVARPVLDRVVFRRLPKATGADYLMRSTTVTRSDEYERLECSALAEGEKETAEARLQKKLDQLARYPDYPPGKAVVTDFRSTPVTILVGSWRQ